MPEIPPPPVARRDEVVDDHHGTAVADPYRWLEDLDAPDTDAWIDAQNERTESWLSHVEARKAIRERLEQLTDHPRRGAPWHRGNRWFQLRNTGLQDQDVVYAMDGPGDEGRVLLDPNRLSEDGTVALTGLAPSDDGALLAYATSAAGSDWMTWRVRDVDTGEDFDDEVRWSKFSTAAWLPDGSGFFYSRYDEPAEGDAYEGVNLDQRLHLHRLGHPCDDDELVYARPDQPEWGFLGETTFDGRFLVVTVTHGTDPRNRIHLLELETPGAKVRPLLDAFDAAYEFIGAVDRRFYFLTDLAAPRGRVVAVDLDQPERDSWQEIVAESDDALESVRLVGGRLLALYLSDAHHRLRLFGLDGAELGDVELGAYASVESVTGRQDDDVVHFTAATFTAPAAVHRLDLDTRQVEKVFEPGLDFAAADYVTEQVFVTSSDGERVPVFLVHHRDVVPDGERPVWLYGYGGFRIAVTPGCRTEWLVWLENGGVVAVANLRGGGEYGQSWHDAGRLANKQQVFDDAIAVAEHLTGASGGDAWTRPGKIAIHGRSNGGLLAGACLTQRPDLWGAAVPEVGVLDMLRFHTFTIGWAWASDYGTADDAEQFGWLHAYSPLHRIVDGTAYPATLVTTGDHDDRVVPGHSYKFTAALQAAQGGPAPVLIRVDRSAGHGAGKPTSLLVAERADVVAFLCATLGLAGRG